MKNSILRLILVFCCSISFQVGHSQEISKSHYVSAKEYLKKDSVRLALAELDSATQISPNFSEAYMLKGQIWENKENYRKAIGQYSLAVLYDPKLTQAYLRRAELHFKLKDHRDYVLYDVGEAIRFDPENAEFYALKAYYYAHTISPETLKPDYENAIRSITHAIQLNPENALYFKERSEYKFRYEQPLSALADIDKAIEKDAQGFDKNKDAAIEGGTAAGKALDAYEKETQKKEKKSFYIWAEKRMERWKAGTSPKPRL